MGQSPVAFSSTHVRDISDTQIAVPCDMLFQRFLKFGRVVFAAAGLSWVAAAAQTSTPPPAVPDNGAIPGKVAVLPVTGETKIHGSTLSSTGSATEEPLGDAARRVRKHKKHRKHVTKAKVHVRHQHSSR
jgi:hypothetical protein